MNNTWGFEYEAAKWGSAEDVETVHQLTAKTTDVTYPEISIWRFDNGYTSVRWNSIDCEGTRCQRQTLGTHHLPVVLAALPKIAFFIYNGVQPPW